MAKGDDISLIEQHVEKGVLLLCLILLVYAVMHWFLSSPVQIDGVPPNEIDQKLAKRAEALRDNIEGQERAQADLPPGPKTIDNLQQGPAFEPMKNFAVGQLPLDVRMGGPSLEPPTVEELAKVMPAPEGLVAWAGCRVPVKDAEPDPDNLADVPGALGRFFYPQRKLGRLWAQMLRGTQVKLRLVVVGVRVKVQEAGSQGQFDQERNLTPTPGPAVDQEGNPIKVPVLPEYTGENTGEVRQVISELEEGKVQGQILRPEYWNIWDGAAERAIGWRTIVPEALRKSLTPAADGIAPGWFHHDGLASRNKYRYKVQLVMLNPLFTEDKSVNPKRPQDAQTPTVASPWSPWCEPVSVPKITRFLLTGSNRLAKSVRVTVFTRSLGQQKEKAFKLWPGQPIGHREGKVDYSTGAIVIALDFERYILRGHRQIKTTEMLYLDGNGVLRSRIYAVDRRKLEAMRRPKP